MKKILFILSFPIAFLNVNGQSPLQDYLTEASANNQGLQARYSEFQASLESVARIKGLPNPTLSFGYFIQPVETRLGPQQAKISLSQMFPWFGSLSAKGDAAAAMAQAKYMQFIDAREKLKSEVKGSYYEIWQIGKTLELERENLQVLESYGDLATTKVRGGNGKFSSVYRVQMQVEETQTKIRILEDQLVALKRSFNSLLNREAGQAVMVADTILTDVNLPVLDSNQRHPAVMQFEEMKSGAEFQYTAARKSGLPSFGLGLDYVWVGPRSDMAVPDNGKDIVMPMISVSLPVWQKQYAAARKEAGLAQQQYKFQAREVRNTIRSKTEMAFFKLHQAGEEIKLYEREVVLAQKTLQLTITDYSNDREDFEEILRLQQKIIQFKKSKLKAYQDYLQQMANLTYLTYQFAENETK